MRIVLRYARRGRDKIPKVSHCVAAGGGGGAASHLRHGGCGPCLHGMAIRERVGWLVQVRCNGRDNYGLWDQWEFGRGVYGVRRGKGV